MSPAEIIAFATEELEPLPDPLNGARYRCAAYLVDGLYLPCVVLQSAAARVDLARRRLEETRPVFSWFGKPRPSSIDFDDVLASFTASGNRLNHFDIRSLEPSPNALPLSLLQQIEGETSMGWTQFQVEMTDGRIFDFGTTFRYEFFEIPDGYSVEDMTRVIPAPMLAPKPAGTVLRERPFFTCFVEGLH